MFAALKRNWRAFRDAKPGERFRKAHERRRAEGSSVAGKVLSIGIGVVLVAAGIVALFLPGPGVLFIGLGAAFLARESAVMARGMDRLELWLRHATSWMKRRWKQAAPLARVSIALLALLVVGAAGYGAWTQFIAK